MKRLTIGRARDLIKRELGLSATSLTAPSDMNNNPNYPLYEMFSGTQRIVVTTKDIRQGKYTDKMISLCVTRENSLKYSAEYFYGDTLEFADIYTEWQNRESFCEAMENPNDDPILHRLKNEALNDGWKHFHVQPVNQEKKMPHRDAETDAAEKEFWAMNDHLEHGGDIADFDETHLADWARNTVSQPNPLQTSNNNATSTSSKVNNLNSDAILEKAAWESFQGKLLRGHDLFMIRVFNRDREYYSDAGPLDETQLDWWIKEVTRGVNNNPEEAAGFTIFKWNRNEEIWWPYCPDGANEFTYDTGRRSDGTVHEDCKKRIPQNYSLNEKLTTAHQEANSQNEFTHKAKSEMRL
jgi:hypothetical protein